MLVPATTLQAGHPPDLLPWLAGAVLLAVVVAVPFFAALARTRNVTAMRRD